jgi:two-component system, cell cycle sensor histidine kinase and response regulator CckA
MLAGGIAHQFNNILVAVQGHLSFLRDDLPEPERHLEDLEGIARAVDRAAVLVDQLLVISGKQVFLPDSVDLNSSLRQLEPMVREVVDSGTDLVLELAPGVGNVAIDADRLEQVILGLAETSRQVMPEGGGTVTIRTQVVPKLPGRPLESRKVPPSHYALLTMSDTSSGIDEVHLRHVFDPFFSTEFWNEELDAGMATVYGIVRGSGGHLDVESSPGDGCRFSLYLPGVEDSQGPEGERGGSEIPAP